MLKKLFRFLKDFEICPYLLNAKTVFMVYYFTCISLCRNEEPQIIERRTIEMTTAALSVKSGIKRIMRTSMNQSIASSNALYTQQADHPELSFNQFLIINFRVAVIFFDMNFKSANTNLGEVKNYKKLLSLLSRIELTSGYSAFIGEVR